MNVLYVKGSLTTKSLSLSDAGVNFTTIMMRVFLKSSGQHDKYEMIIFDGYAIEDEMNYQDFITLRNITSDSYPYALLISMDEDISKLKKAEKIGVFTKIGSNKLIKEIQTKRVSEGKESKKINEDDAFWGLIHSKLKSTVTKSIIIIPDKLTLFENQDIIISNNLEILDDQKSRITKTRNYFWQKFDWIDWVLIGLMLGGIIFYIFTISSWDQLW